MQNIIHNHPHRGSEIWFMLKFTAATLAFAVSVVAFAIYMGA